MDNCPIINLTVKVWTFWSFICVHNSFRYFVIPVFVLNIFQFMDLYRAWGNIQEVIMNMYFTILYFNAVLRAIILIKNRVYFEKFIEQMVDVYDELSSIKDAFIKNTITTYTARARTISKINLWLGLIISIFFCIYPLFTGERSLPYGVWIPFLDNFKSPTYELLYAIQIFLTAPGCHMYLPFTNFYTSSTLFGIIQIKALQQQLKTIADSDDEEVEVKLNRYIKVHKRIIKYVEDLNSIVTYMCFVEFMSFGLMLIALLFLLNIIQQRFQFWIVFAYIITILSQVFTWYWHSNELREESMNIGLALYDESFMEFSIPVKRKMLFMMMRSQNPLEIKVGNIYPMTLEMFQTLLNSAYSYFNIIRTMYN